MVFRSRRGETGLVEIKIEIKIFYLENDSSNEFSARVSKRGHSFIT